MAKRAQLEMISHVRLGLKFSRIHYPPGPWEARGEHPLVTIYNAENYGCITFDTNSGFGWIPETERGEFIARTLYELQIPKDKFPRIK